LLFTKDSGVEFKLIPMAHYLIEIPHENTRIECLRSIEILLSSGSHFLTNADWGCLDGEHKAWFFMDAENKEEAIMIVPPAYRKDTKITQLTKFKMKEVQEMLNKH
jgi:hypothetical protein